MARRRDDDETDDDEQAEPAYSFSEWQLWITWDQYRMVGGRRTTYHFADPPVVYDDEDQAFRGMAEALIVRRQNDEVAQAELVRIDYRQVGRRKSRETVWPVVSMGTTQLDATPSASGILPLATTLKRLRVDQTRVFGESEKAQSMEGLVACHGELAQATAAMGKRRDVLG